MDSILIEKDFIGAMEDIVEFLRKKGYPEAVKLPYKKGNIFSIINDIIFFLGRGRGLFKSSFLYRFRRWIFNDRDLVFLCDFFMYNKEVSYSGISSLLGEEKVRDFLKLSIFTEEAYKNKKGSTFLKSQVRIIPFGGEYFICDPFDRKIPDFVWIGSDSLLLADRLKRLNYDTKLAVDIGSGSGIQAITLSICQSSKVIAIDINEKGLKYAMLNAIINKRTNISFVRSDMLSAVKGGIDTIVSNPPFIFLPPGEETVNRDGYGGKLGLEKIIYILKMVPQYLNPNGQAFILTLSPVISGKNILMDQVKRIFDRNYSIDFEVIDYVYIREFKELYDSENISYFVQGMLKISKTATGARGLQLSIKDAPKMKKLLSFVKIMANKAFYKNYAHAA